MYVFYIVKEVASGFNMYMFSLKVCCIFYIVRCVCGLHTHTHKNFLAKIATRKVTQYCIWIVLRRWGVQILVVGSAYPEWWVIALMMEAARTSETLVNFYQTTRRYNPEDSHLHTRHRENLKSYFHIVLIFSIYLTLPPCPSYVLLALCLGTVVTLPFIFSNSISSVKNLCLESVITEDVRSHGAQAAHTTKVLFGLHNGTGYRCSMLCCCCAFVYFSETCRWLSEVKSAPIVVRPPLLKFTSVCRAQLWINEPLDFVLKKLNSVLTNYFVIKLEVQHCLYENLLLYMFMRNFSSVHICHNQYLFYIILSSSYRSSKLLLSTVL
jgi:hypothetical protein